MTTHTQRPDTWSLEQIVCPLDSADSTAAIRELINQIAHVPGVKDATALRTAIESREQHAHTYLGGSIAMPHARSDGVERLVIAVGLSQSGIPWGRSPERARLIFLIGIPRGHEAGYLDVVRRITQAVRRIDWIEQAVACPDAPALHALLKHSIPL